MNKAHVTFWAPDGTFVPQTDVEFASEKGSLHFRMGPGVIEVMNGNIVLAAYANIPVVARNMDPPDAVQHPSHADSFKLVEEE